MEFHYLSNAIYFMAVLAAGLILWFGGRKRMVIVRQLNMLAGQAFLKNLFLISGMVLLVVSLMGPREEDGVHEVDREGLDIYVLVDTSKSMDATDVAPTRLDRAKKIVESLLEDLNGDRIGFIPYASSAYIQMPLTDDYDLAKMYLDVMDTDMIGGGGTDVLQAVELASRSFDQVSGGQKVILVLSDGEAHDMDYSQLASYQATTDFKIYTIGIGTEKGILLSVTDETTGELVGYKKDSEGQVVTTRLDEEQLMTMASATGGRYYASDVAMTEVQSLVKDLSYLERGQQAPTKVKLYQERYQWFLLPAIVCLLLGILLPWQAGPLAKDERQVVG